MTPAYIESHFSRLILLLTLNIRYSDWLWLCSVVQNLLLGRTVNPCEKVGYLIVL